MSTIFSCKKGIKIGLDVGEIMVSARRRYLAFGLNFFSCIVVNMYKKSGIVFESLVVDPSERENIVGAEHDGGVSFDGLELVVQVDLNPLHSRQFLGVVVPVHVLERQLP